MALRDQPYLPLYIQDFLTDEKLIECSAQATGIYIRIMCIMHKSDEYGKILLRQKDKQDNEQIKNFALKVAKHVPYELPVIMSGILELLEEGCLEMVGDYLIQKRMVKDGELSVKRSESGKLGGESNKKNLKKNKNFAQAKHQANSENEDEYNIDIDSITNTDDMLVQKMKEIWLSCRPDYCYDDEVDFPAFLKIAQKIGERKGWSKQSLTNGAMIPLLDAWEQMAKFINHEKTSAYLKSFTIDGLSNPKNFQKVEEAYRISDVFKLEKIKLSEKNRISEDEYFDK